MAGEKLLTPIALALPLSVLGHQAVEDARSNSASAGGQWMRSRSAGPPRSSIERATVGAKRDAADIARVDLGDDEELAARHAGVRDGAAHVLLVAIHLGGVDVAEPMIDEPCGRLR